MGLPLPVGMTRLLPRHLLLATLVVSAPVAVAQDPADAPPARPDIVPLVMVGPTLRQPLLELPEALQEDLRAGRWSQAVEGLRAVDASTLPGPLQGTRAFVLAWALVHAGKAEEALPLLDLALKGEGVPKAWADLLEGEVRLAAGDAVPAMDALARIPEGTAPWARAQIVRAEALRELGRTKEAFEVYEALAAQEDPHPGTAEALLALAGRAGAGSDAAYAYLRRVWYAYPKSEASRKGWDALAAYGRNPTWQEKARRAYHLMYLGHYDTVRAEVDGLTPPAADRSDDACKLLYAKGRSHYKRNRLGASIAGFGDIGTRCTDASDDWGARGLYLAGTAQFRKGQYTASASTFAKIPELYPESSYADDGYMKAGISLQEAEDLDGARSMWSKALEGLPDGDTTPESTWRLAWTWYLDGEPEKAIAIAERLGRLPLESDRRHVEAGRYWAARWRLYPDVDNPTEENPVPGAKAEAIALWRDLCRDLPWSYYSILAYSRLKEVAPDVAAELAKRPEGHDAGDMNEPWQARLAFVADPQVRAGIDLARMGLVREARAAWSHAETPAELPDEVAWLMELRIQAGDWLYAHDDMRDWLLHQPPGTLGEHEPQILRVAYPDRYWDEVQVAAEPYRYEPRLLHGLVREESNFNRHIRSHAGAIGLSQLMPYTAKQTADWLKKPVGDLDDPANNLSIGAKYLDVVHGQVGGSPFLALAGYNAGPGRVRQWLGEWGNVPTDEYVERIPYRETRGYVRRVTTTWQTYRYQFDEVPAYPDMSRFNHQAKPDAGG